MIKAIIFDFDNTLEEWIPHEDEVEEQFAHMLSEKYSLDKDAFLAVFNAIKSGYFHSRSLPQDYGRDIWFSESLAHFNIHNADIASLVSAYWDALTARIRLFPDVKPVLEELRKDFSLGILSDSDGDRKWKDMRIKKLGIEQYFQVILTSDEVRVNKPHPRGFLEVCRRLGVSPKEAIMVGDNPVADLSSAKMLGMTTVWTREGLSERQKNKSFAYIDYSIESFSEVLSVVKTITQK